MLNNSQLSTVMLDARKAAILTAVVEEYIETAQPVGSSAVLAAAGLNVSPATIRNDMAGLESEGFLVQPHTSAGRVPTEKGYRYFVDSRPGVELLHPERHQITAFFTDKKVELEHLLRSTAALLSDLTRYAAVVVDQSADTVTVRSVQVVDLSPTLVLLVVILSNGAVEKHSIESPHPVDEDDVVWLSMQLSVAFVDRQLGQPAPVARSGKHWLDELTATMINLARDHGPDSDRVYVNGASHLATEFNAVDTVRKVLSILEQQLVVVNLMSGMIERGLNVAIGTETGEERLDECSVVISPYEIGGERAGSIAVLGPTRMNYPQAMAAVAVVSRQLGRRLSEG